jgi:hypothetical protein
LILEEVEIRERTDGLSLWINKGRLKWTCKEVSSSIPVFVGEMSIDFLLCPRNFNSFSQRELNSGSRDERKLEVTKERIQLEIKCTL